MSTLSSVSVGAVPCFGPALPWSSRRMSWALWDACTSHPNVLPSPDVNASWQLPAPMRSIVALTAGPLLLMRARSSRSVSPAKRMTTRNAFVGRSGSSNEKFAMVSPVWWLVRVAATGYHAGGGLP